MSEADWTQVLGDCPGPDTLAAFGAGQLAPDRRPAVATHVRHCPRCRTALEGQSGASPPPLTSVSIEATGQPPPGEGPAAGTRYRALRFHARGGLGEVHVAYDVELDREVAVKRIRPERAGEDGSRRRFVREAEITAKLEHPGVVPVYGLAQGQADRPGYAMRLIRGESLQEAVDRFHAANRPGRDPGERGLALRHLLGHFVAACNTLAYAHSRGVVHRDVKPANIMLGKYGETLVVDWGLAKYMGEPEGQPVGASRDGSPSPAPAAARPGPDPPAFSASDSPTVMGQALGTPGYMGPEQAAGDWDRVGPASDVYGLGATLYAVLTGKPPFAGRGAVEVLRQVRGGQIVPPHRVKADVPHALEAVCLKAMALRPEDRYASALELAADVENWLADEPVTAYREPWAGRARRWARRHRALAAGGAAALVALLLAGGVAWWWVTADRHARRLAAEARQAEAVRGVEQALAEADLLRGQVRAGDGVGWSKALAAARRAEALLEQGGDREDLRRRVRDLLVELAAEERDRRMLARLEEVRLRQAELRAGGFDFARAAGDYAAAFRYYGVDVLRLPPAEAAVRLRRRPIRVQLAGALDHWAAVSDPRGAEGRRLLMVARRTDLDPFRNRLRDALGRRDLAALRELAGRADLSSLSPATGTLLGAALTVAGDQAGAIRLLGRAQRLYPSDFWVNHQLAVQLMGCRPPRADEAIRFYTAAVAVRRQSPGAHVNLGNALLARGRHDEAAACYRAAIRLEPNYAEAHSNLGVVFFEQGRYDRAVTAFRRALRIKPSYARGYFNLGNGLVRQGKRNEAVAAYRQAIRLEKDYAVAHYNLGTALEEAGRHDEAAACYRRAIGLQKDPSGAYFALGNLEARRGRLAEAEAAYRSAVRLRPAFPDAWINLGNVCIRGRQLGDAAACYREALRYEKDNFRAYFDLAVLHLEQGQYAEAEAACRQALRLQKDYPPTHYNLGTALLRQGRAGEAAACFREAVRLREDFAPAHCNLGLALQHQGRFAEALAALRRGHELGSRDPGWRNPSAQWVADCERLLALDRRLPALLKGREKPADAGERAEVARFCQRYKDLPAAAARWYAEAFRDRPALAGELRNGHRCDAACAAACAGCGRGKDAGGLDDAARGRWRKQAREWLEADLALWNGLLAAAAPGARGQMQHVVRHWQTDAALAAVRDPGTLTLLPEAERRAWQKLWADVAALDGRARGAK
jgi:serine/threonine-protein kinase